jgi:hypothetical protein
MSALGGRSQTVRTAASRQQRAPAARGPASRAPRAARRAGGRAPMAAAGAAQQAAAAEVDQTLNPLVAGLKVRRTASRRRGGLAVGRRRRASAGPLRHCRLPIAPTPTARIIILIPRCPRPWR